MAFLGESFSYDPNIKDEFALLPPGWYQASIEQADIATTKDGSGSYIKVTWRIIGGDHHSRVIWQNILIGSASEKARTHARVTMNKLAQCCGRAISDTQHMIGITAEIRVATGEASQGYEAKSEVKDIRPGANNPATMFAATQPQQAAPVPQQQAIRPPQPTGSRLPPTANMPRPY